MRCSRPNVIRTAARSPRDCTVSPPSRWPPRPPRRRGRPPRSQASFSVPGLFPGYGPYVHDYVVRCDDAPVRVNAHVADPWRMSIAGAAARAGDFSRHRPAPLRDGLHDHGPNDQAGGRPSRYHVRCLPSDFPTYTFTRYGPVSPDYFAADTGFAPVKNRYAMIFDRHGVPIWWYRAPAVGPRVLPSGNVLWFLSNGQSSRYEIRGLDGSLVRTPDAPRAAARSNTHDLQLLVQRRLPDRRPHEAAPRRHSAPTAGRVTPTCGDAELQEVGRDGRAALGLEERGPHLARRDRSLVALGHRAPDRGRVLRPRPLELDRAARRLGDRLVQAPRRRVPDQEEQRIDRLEAGRHAHAPKPRGPRRSRALHLRRAARRPPRPRRDPDRVRQSHRAARPGAPRGALPDRSRAGNRDPRAVDQRSRRHAPRTDAGRLGSCRIRTG